MFLKPQHLQQHDLFLESRDIAYLRALEHYGWGLEHIEIMSDALNNYMLEVKTLRAVLPDGTLVDVPGNARLPGRALDRRAVEAGRSLDVFLGVRRLEGSGPQSASAGAAAGEARFAAVMEEIYDLDAGRDPAPIEHFEYDLRFFVGDEPSTGYETLPLARLAFTGNPARPIQHAPGFAPPSLALSASTCLHDAARAVVEKLSTVLRMKAKVLGMERVSDLILFQALCGCLPVLKDMVNDGNVHPRRAYQEMARLAGTLHFRDEAGRSFDEIPLYDHRNPGPVFLKLQELIDRRGRYETDLPYRKIPMDREKTGDLFRAGLSSEVRMPGVRLFLQATAAESSPKIKGMLQTAKISAPGRIDYLKSHAVPGIANEPQAGPPPELPRDVTGSFFRLKLDEGSEWPTHVVPNEALAVFLMGAPRDVNLILWAMLGARQGLP